MRFNAKTSEYFLELLRCALHDKPARPKPQEVSWSDLFEYAKGQSLSTMAYSAIRKAGFDVGERLADEWSACNARNLVKYFNQEHECEALCRTFSDAGILHMPLKGSMIRRLYPAPEMREMCDLDFLVKPEDVERAHELMLADGFSYIEDKTTSHNREYHKLPYLNVEIHHYLLPQENDMFSYYADYWNDASYERNGMTCRMTWSDCYIFMMAHAKKHFSLHGTGVRFVLDVYVMRERLKDALDGEYIAEELKKLGILAFAERFERLADCWFANDSTELPKDLHEYQDRILESGTYGDGDTMRSEALSYVRDGGSFRAAKRRMALRKIFPSYTYMKTMYPALKYVPFLLPLFWVIRWVKTLVVKPKKVSAFFKKLKHLSIPADREDRR